MADKLDKIQESIEKHAETSRKGIEDVKQLIMDGAIVQGQHKIKIENLEDARVIIHSRIDKVDGKVSWLFRSIFTGFLGGVGALIVWLVKGGGK